jgi:tetratricopeptide (TPR) repeat protein
MVEPGLDSHSPAAGASAAGPGTSLPDAIRAALASDDVAAAIALCEARIQDDSRDADAHRHLGQIHAGCGDHVPAMHAAMRACALAPDDPRAWSDLGRVHAMAGELAHAVRCFTEAVEIDARHADGWHNLGTALKQLGQREQAFAALKNALLLDPKRAETYLNLGNLLIASGQYQDAIECFERAAKHDPALARARSSLAEQMSARGKVKRAEALFRQALGLDPDHVEGWLGLGRALEDVGEAEGARGAYLNVLRRRPGHAFALGAYVALLREKDAQETEAAHFLSGAEAALLDGATPDPATALIGYGLAKHHDRRGHLHEAAQAAKSANAARRRESGPLARAELAERVDGIIRTYTPDFFSSRRRYGVGNDQPVFIVGLPRSGTTLTEQILAAHPMLHGSGELPDLARLAASVGKTDADEPWQATARVDAGESRALAGDYLRALRDSAPRRQIRYSDKSPLNFFQLAFAAVLFPNARVIHCARDPRDTALSIWMENFNAEQTYATGFEDLAFFAAQYERLMTHWRQVLPLPILEMRYEETVADVETQARRLIDFLGAPWDARCLEFHRSERAVQTPSRWQVRQPIYAGSVGRWRRYAEFLPELVAAFPSGGPTERSAP